MSSSYRTVLKADHFSSVIFCDSMTAIMHPSFYSTGPAGTLVPSIEVKVSQIFPFVRSQNRLLTVLSS